MHLFNDDPLQKPSNNVTVGIDVYGQSLCIMTPPLPVEWSIQQCPTLL